MDFNSLRKEIYSKKASVKELVNDAKNLEIYGNPPSIKALNTQTDIIEDQIHFGLIDIKSVGAKQIDKFRDAIVYLEQTLGKQLCEVSWYEFLVLVSQKINSRMLTALISVGFFADLPESRQQMLDEFDTWSNITKKEAEWAEDNFEKYNSLVDLLRVMAPVKKDGGAAFNSKRSQIISDLVIQCENPSYSLKDDPEWVIRTEENYLGIGLTYSRVEPYDTSLANTTIKEYING